MTFIAEGNAVLDIESLLWKIGEGIHVMRLYSITLSPALLTGAIIANKYGRSPDGIV